MRLHFANMTRPRLVAKALRKALARHRLARPLAECQEITARLFGYANWHELGKLHAAGAVSLDDAIVPSHAGYRRQHYARTLTSAGVPHQTVDAVLDAVRPSDRSAPPFVAPADFPRLVVEAHETDEQGTRILSLGLQDLTAAVVSRMVPYRGSPLRPFPEHLTVQSVGEGLSFAARTVGYAGRLSLPGFNDALAAFVERVGPGRMSAFKDRLDRIRSAVWALEGAATELERVRRAEFSEDLSRSDCYFLHGDEFAFDREDWYSHWDWDAYVKANPRPPLFDSPQYADWERARDAYVAAHAPPYVFATSPLRWRGVDAADIRERIAELEPDEDYDVDHLLESEMDQHHEDAYDQIVDASELQDIAESWRKTPTSRRRFATLEKKVAAWNAKQSIVSYFQDSGLIMPAFPGKSKEDAVAWCEATLAARIAALRDLHVWAAEAPEPESEDAFRP